MSEVDSIQTLVTAAAHQPVQIDGPDGRKFVALPAPAGAYTLQEITSPNGADVLKPKNVDASVDIQTATSLVVYVNRFKNADTMLFANIDQNEIVAVIDYHKQPEANAGTGAEGVNAGHDASPELGEHVATLHLPFSEEWATWQGNNGKLMTHVDFATFLEENSMDVVEPVGATLLETCRDLQVKSGVNFNSSVRMGDTVEVEYQKGDDVSTKDKIGLPTQIKINIPVYFGEEPVLVTAFLRRKVDNGMLRLGYVLSRSEQVRQAEFHRVVSEIEGGVDLTTVYGIK